MNLLRFALRLDAAASALFGVAALAFSGQLDEWLGTPTAFTLVIGVYLLIWAVALAVLSMRAQIAPGAVWAVIALNGAWIAASLALAFGAAFDLTGWGVAFAAVQAAGVLLFADLEYLGLRKARTA